MDAVELPLPAAIVTKIMRSSGFSGGGGVSNSFHQEKDDNCNVNGSKPAAWKKMSDDDIYRHAGQLTGLRNGEAFVDNDMVSVQEGKQSQRKTGKASRSNGSSGSRRSRATFMEGSLNVSGVGDVNDLPKELGSYPGKYNISVADQLIMWPGVVCGSWDWARAISSGSELLELRQLLMLCQSVELGDGSYRLVWLLDGDERFLVKSIKQKIHEVRNSQPEYILEWNNWVPKKVCIVAWRAELERLPTRDTLSKRSIGISSALCLICGEVVKTSEHLFVSCGLAQATRQAISLWCKVPSLFAFNFRDILALHKFSRFWGKKAKAFHAIYLITVWCLWKARNKLVFEGAPVDMAAVIEEIKSFGFLWIKNRSKMVNCLGQIEGVLIYRCVLYWRCVNCFGGCHGKRLARPGRN